MSPLQRISERIYEQIVDAPVPHGTVSAPLSAVAVKRQKNRKKKKSPEGDFCGDHVEADPQFRVLMSRLRGVFSEDSLEPACSQPSSVS